MMKVRRQNEEGKGEEQEDSVFYYIMLISD